jgi:glutathione S-transferase
MTTPITVHGIPGSPFLRAVLLAFEEKGAPWRLAPIGPGGNRTEAYLAMMPFGRVPAIQHEGLTLYETQAVLRWADAVFAGQDLQPADPRAAARMNQIMGVTDWYVFRSWSAPIAFERVIKPTVLGLPTDEAAIAPALPLARTTVEVLDAMLGAGPYMVGDRISLADLHLAPHLEYFSMTPEGRDMLAGTALLAYLARMQSRPSWSATATESLRQAA